MNTTCCNFDFYEQDAPSLSFNEKLSVAAALAFSLAFSGGMACLAVDVLLRLQA